MKTTMRLSMISIAGLFMTACDSEDSSNASNGVSGTSATGVELASAAERFSFDDTEGLDGGPAGENIGVDLSARAQTLSSMVSTDTNGAGDSSVWQTIQGFGTAPYESQRLNPENVNDTTSRYNTSDSAITDDKSNLAGAEDVVYNYVKNGKHTYSLTCNLPDTTKDEVEQSISQLFGLDAEIDDQFRQLLFKPSETTPNFTRVELQDMVDAIIAAGQTQERWLIVDPDEDQIILLDDSQIIINCTSTSTNRDILFNAEMSGSFSADLYGVHRRIAFRRPNLDEINTFNDGVRALTPEHWLPVVEEMPVKDFINIQSGNYTDSLVNTPVGIFR